MLNPLYPAFVGPHAPLAFPLVMRSPGTAVEIREQPVMTRTVVSTDHRLMRVKWPRLLTVVKYSLAKPPAASQRFRDLYLLAIDPSGPVTFDTQVRSLVFPHVELYNGEVCFSDDLHAAVRCGEVDPHGAFWNSYVEVDFWQYVKTPVKSHFLDSSLARWLYDWVSGDLLIEEAARE